MSGFHPLTQTAVRVFHLSVLKAVIGQVGRSARAGVSRLLDAGADPDGTDEVDPGPLKYPAISSSSG